MGRSGHEGQGGGEACAQQAPAAAGAELLAAAGGTVQRHDFGAHPRNKQEVGRRLALAARALACGEESEHSGPVYDSMAVEGSRIRPRFKHVGGGLVAQAGQPLKQFTIAAADRKFVWADARIDGDAVVVSSPRVAEPVAVRYAWADNPEGCNRWNRAGLPAPAFRTDQWPGFGRPWHK